MVVSLGSWSMVFLRPAFWKWTSLPFFLKYPAWVFVCWSLAAETELQPMRPQLPSLTSLMLPGVRSQRQGYRTPQGTCLFPEALH